jgi:hypothetical protein
MLKFYRHLRAAENAVSVPTIVRFADKYAKDNMLDIKVEAGLVLRCGSLQNLSFT